MEAITNEAFEIYGSFAMVVIVLVVWLKLTITKNNELTEKLTEIAEKNTQVMESVVRKFTDT